MKFLECDLEQIIMSTPNHVLREKGLGIGGRKRNQVRLGEYGIADIVTMEGYHFGKPEAEYKPLPYTKCVSVYELKRDKISLSTFAQGIQYVRGIQEYFMATGRDCSEYMFQLCLVGRMIKEGEAIAVLPSLLNHDLQTTGFRFRMILYDYDFNGITFEDASNCSYVENEFNI